MGQLFRRYTALAALTLSLACTTSQTPVPGVTGPSELALSLRVAAIPDSISQDGASQSSIIVTAFDSNGRPCGSLPVRMDMMVGGSVQDFGTLSGRTIVTGSNGQASTVYTAPPPPPPSAGGSGNTVSIVATPSSSVACGSTPAVANFDAVNRQLVAIRLVPPGVILPPAGTPTADFTMSPANAVAGSPLTFNASTSTPGTGATSITSYSWDFGDASVAGSGVNVTHTFNSAQTFIVTLTVTNDRGVQASKRVSTAVAAPPTPPSGTQPTPLFTFSPGAPGVGDTVFFNAGTSTAGSGHTIVSYAWTFGDGATGVGVAPTHAYTQAGSYAVQLKVTDEIGQSATSAATNITIGNPPSPTTNFTFSPSTPGRFDQVVFDASSSTTAQGQTIVDVAWNFGDGTAVIHCPGGSIQDCPGPTNRISAHTFNVNTTFIVNLVVTDSAGRIGSKNTPVTVALADPTVVIQTSPGSPNPGNPVQFNSTGTTFYPGTRPPPPAVGYFWTFGDGGTSTLANPAHTYAAVGAYGVGLSVTDPEGRTGTATATVTVVAVTPPTPPTPPTAAFSFSQPSNHVPSTVFFDGSASNGTNLTYAWNFGDGSFGAGATPTKSYAAVGQYNVTLTVTDSSGGHATSAPQTVTVVP